MSTIIKVADSRGRVTLGRSFASRLVAIRKLANGVLQVNAVPEHEAWLHRDPKALESVVQGIEQARRGKTGRGPDLKRVEKLLKAMEK